MAKSLSTKCGANETSRRHWALSRDLTPPSVIWQRKVVKRAITDLRRWECAGAVPEHKRQRLEKFHQAPLRRVLNIKSKPESSPYCKVVPTLWRTWLSAALRSLPFAAGGPVLLQKGMPGRPVQKRRHREGGMDLTRRNGVARIIAVTMAVAGPLLPATAMAQDKTIVMKISLAALNDPLHQFAKDFAALIEKDSGGRIKTEIYPASQLGSIPRQIEGTQFGAIQCEITLPEFYAGVDERYEVMSAPGLVDGLANAQRLTGDPAVRKLILGLGADKGLHGVALFTSQPSQIIARTAIRHLDDLKGEKLRIFGSRLQTEGFGRLGVTAVAMSLGDVLPALQQGAIDGAVAGTVIFSAMHYQDAAKYVTDIGQPVAFGIATVNKKWYDSLPADLQQIIDKDAAAANIQVNPETVGIIDRANKAWTDNGGELIRLPPDEQAAMLKTLAAAGAEVAKAKPAIDAAYQIMAAAAARIK
jgi:TRAP-type C4-dicarboxylate transport system substrate-binding protein